MSAEAAPIKIRPGTSVTIDKPYIYIEVNQGKVTQRSPAGNDYGLTLETGDVWVGQGAGASLYSKEGARVNIYYAEEFDQRRAEFSFRDTVAETDEEKVLKRLSSDYEAASKRKFGK
jgi:hypothetical protein